jgi:hypothetical protein
MLFFSKRAPIALRLAVGVVLIALGVTLHMLLLTIAGGLALVIGGVQWYGRHGNNRGSQ